MHHVKTDRTAYGLSILVLVVTWVFSGETLAQNKSNEPLDVWSLQREDGFFSFFWDDATGKVYLEVPRFDEPFLYVSSLATGLGSNPVGLDRGQLGESRVVYWKRVGRKAYLIQGNLKFRATTNNAAERMAVRDSFAESILWSGELKSGAQASSVVDLTDFLLRDAHDCVSTLARRGQGNFSLDRERCFVHREKTKAFPNNSEFEAAVTFTSSKPGELAEQAAADGRSLTLRQHHSFVKLPDDDYRPRRFDPRVGCLSISYSDYGVAIGEPLEQHWIVRHRLKKRTPGPSPSRPVAPIVYYVDSGVPQPVQAALLEGARWWSQAFESAGFLNAFEVRVLPEGVDPMDVRHNVIQWVHRATRGWSYGQSVIDPRTGEIVKGNVLLGSLRVRHDQLLLEGLLDTPGTVSASSCGLGHVPDEGYLSQLAPGFSSIDVALSRIRQLSAHEVGHTLGFAHNFAASTYADRASVMDYPAPRVKIADGKLDLSDAYGVGIGEWDRFTVKYAYSEFAPNAEEQSLAKLVAEAIEQRMLYITDADARPPGAAHPLGNLWDDGSDPLQGLIHAMRVREIALRNFDASILADGQPLSELEKALVPLYLHHRYMVDAVAKMLGGVTYSYAVKGDAQQALSPTPVAQQRAALDTLLKTLEPDVLMIPDSILALIPPRAFTTINDEERFESSTEPMFDSVSAMRAAADLTLANILQPQRASRLARSQEPDWGLNVVIDELITRTCGGAKPEHANAREARRVVQQVLTDCLIQLAGNNSASADARALAGAGLATLEDALSRETTTPPLEAVDQAHSAYLLGQIKRFQTRPAPAAAAPPDVTLPPGSPIGRPR